MGPMARIRASRPLFDRLHFAGALLGLLVVVHLSIMVDRGFDRGCFGFSEPTATVECELVTSSDAGTLMGVSNATWGLGYYAVLVLLGLLAGALDTRRAATWRIIRAAVLTFGVLYSGWLFYVQATEIGAFCKLCLISAGITLALFLLVAADLRAAVAAPSSEPAMKTRFYATVALVAVALAVADLLYFSGLEVASAAPQVEAAPSEAAVADPVPQAPPAAAVCQYDDSVPVYAEYASFLQLGDPYLGSEKADVVVMEFIDPNCPHCATMHPVMKQVAESHGDKAKVYVVPFMLWPDISLLPIEAMYVAAQDGQYYGMLEALFAAQGPNGYTPAQLRSMAEGLGIDGATFMDRLSRGLNREQIVRRRMAISQMGIRGTPAVMINGRLVHNSSKTVACLRQMIDEAAAAG